MSELTAAELRRQVEMFLPKVLKPSRYLGSEWNAIKKDWDKTDVHMAFAFPDVYEVGMSHLGTKILYHLVNTFPEFLCERVFAPWVDMEEKLRQRNLPLYTLESFQPLKAFDVIGFTLQYEMSFTNILNMLDLAGIPLHTEERGAEDPWIIAGGPCAFNPEPLVGFVDFFLLGESEEQFPQVLRLIAEQKKHPLSRREFLIRVAQVQGVYVPDFYHVTYKADGRIEDIKAEPEVPSAVEKALVQDFDQAFFPTNPIVPYMEIVHDRMMLEVMRGCSRGCRFCQAGMIYRPVRERSPETLLKQTEELVRSTGYDEIALTSLSSGDYTCIQPIIRSIMEKHSADGVGVSLPSLRVDSFDVDLAESIQKARKSGLTFAPEAGSQRLRNVINKGVTEENLLAAVGAAFKKGWSNIKLYFMVGLPTETQEDIDGIADLAKKVANLGTQLGRRNVNVTVSTSIFVPKAHTPFQWEPQESHLSVEQKQKYLKDKLRDRRIKYNYHDMKTSYLEAVFAKGDRRLAPLLEWAVKHGCRFDGWSEHFDQETWMQGFKELGIDPHFYANRAMDYDDILPWEHLESGVTKRFLVEEHHRALQEARTIDCRYDVCTGCGICPGRGVQIELKG
ncbi:TIGR03960 family B12-binding radical SAM protein [Desulfosporosinus sp. PR]|uniref:TIGR03960 family B12-binding radical SAM protein n=1 Tax=Candidatus Desulfosporosinus nitrosoreducens TaxID=3401928 RepID=UPI0027FECEC9|nr:TIGR03960 family B12-binding radical SAM protein [Desulfosporosinus sp. PR]MDQ7093832.1 TIGR03960 family B12-binding radical SAM protein [Desulfosporosinus sp. PR]